MAADQTSLFELKGKTAVITGASGAICGKMTEKLAEAEVKTFLLDIDIGKAEEMAAAIC